MKVVGQNIYVHREQLSTVAPELLAAIRLALEKASISEWDEFDLVRYTESQEEFSFLKYSDFLEDAFPKLLKSHKVNLVRSTCAFRDYRRSLNPPILHRKELFGVHGGLGFTRLKLFLLLFHAMPPFNTPMYCC